MDEKAQNPTDVRELRGRQFFKNVFDIIRGILATFLA